MNQLRIYNNSINKNKKSFTDQHIIGMSLMFGLFMPNGSFFYFLVPVVILILGLRYSTLNSIYNSTKFILIFLMLLSLMIFAAKNSDQLDIKGLLRNLVIFELIFFFPFVKNVQIPNIYLYFGLIFIFISQISYMLGIGSVISFFNNTYPYEGDAYYYQSDYLIANGVDMSLTNRSFRLGGLFLNPNQCARYLTILLAIFLCENYNKKFKSILPFLTICFLAIISTGSRTGFLIMALMILWYIYKRVASKGRIYKNLLIVAIILLTTVFILSVGELSKTMRFLDFDEGVDKSLFMKIQIFIDYLSNNTGFIQILFGNFSNDGSSAIQFDSEWGDLFYRYGFLFLITFILFYILIYKNTAPKYRLFFLILLWVVSSTLVLSYRAGFVFLLFLSKYTHHSWQDVNNKKLFIKLRRDTNKIQIKE